MSRSLILVVITRRVRRGWCVMDVLRFSSWPFHLAAFYAAQCFFSKAQVGGEVIGRDPLYQPGVGLHHIQVTFFGPLHAQRIYALFAQGVVFFREHPSDKVEFRKVMIDKL